MKFFTSKIPPLFKRFLGSILGLFVSSWVWNAGDNKITIRLDHPWLFWLSLSTLIWYAVERTPASATIASVLSSLLLLCFLWVRHISKNTAAKRNLKFSAFQVYDELEEEITLINNGYLPILWARFLDRSTLPGHDISSVRASIANSNITWVARTICKQRGVFDLGPLEISMSDPFGIFSVVIECATVEEVVIYPQLAKLPRNIISRTNSVGDQNQLRQAIQAETVSAFTTRPYVPGDPIRRLHWPRTARENELYVKIFEPESSGNIWLVPDFDSQVQVGHGSDSTSEYLATLLASISNRLLRENLSVGLFAWTDSQTVELPRRGIPHHWNLLKAIAPLQPQPAISFDRVIAAARDLSSPQDLIIAITPSLNTEWASLANRRTVLAILLDPQSFSGEKSAVSSARELQAKGVATRIILKEEVQPIKAAYGPLSRWEFQVLSSGRVIVHQKPHKLLSKEKAVRQS